LEAAKAVTFAARPTGGPKPVQATQHARRSV